MILSTAGIIASSMINYDPDAEAYFIAAGITDFNQKSAYNAFVLSAKADGYYSKFIALYPIIGGTATTHAVNAVNPGTYDLTFFGSPTHSLNGIQWNGSTQYATTGLSETIAGISYYDNSLGFYSRTATGSQVNEYFDMGAGDNGGGGYSIFTYRESPSYSAGYDSANETSNRVSFDPLNDGSGAYIGSSESGTATVYKNGSALNSLTPAGGSAPLAEFYVGGWRFVNAGTNTEIATFYSPRQGCYYHYAFGLTPTEVGNLFTAMNTLQTALGRNVY